MLTDVIKEESTAEGSRLMFIKALESDRIGLKWSNLDKVFK